MSENMPLPAKARLVNDPELQAMSRMADELAGLEEPARSRVVAWLVSRYGMTVVAPVPLARRNGDD